MITKDEIKAWLKTTGTSRQQLAERVGASKGTVNNWLSGADPIPQLKLQLIERIMESDNAQPSIHQPVPVAKERAIAIPLTSDEYEAVKRAANGKDLDLYVHDVVMEEVQRILATPPDVPIFLAVHLPRAVASPKET